MRYSWVHPNGTPRYTDHHHVLQSLCTGSK